MKDKERASGPNADADDLFVMAQQAHSQLPDFIGKVKELVDQQQREVERAIIARGKY